MRLSPSFRDIVLITNADLVGTDIDTITASLVRSLPSSGQISANGVFCKQETSLQLFGVPPKLIISLIFLYLLLGWSAFVALFTIMAFAPLSVKVSKSYGKVQEEIMKVCCSSYSSAAGD